MSATASTSNPYLAKTLLPKRKQSLLLYKLKPNFRRCRNLKKVDDDDDDDDDARHLKGRLGRKTRTSEDEDNENEAPSTKNISQLLVNKWDIELGLDPTDWCISRAYEFTSMGKGRSAD